MRESLQQFLFAGNRSLSPSISLQFTLLQPKITKKSLKSIFLGFKVIDVDMLKISYAGCLGLSAAILANSI